MGSSWVTCFSELSDLRVFVNLCEVGLSHGQEALESVDLRRKVARALREPDPFPSDDDYDKAKRHAARVSEFARGKGHPYLFGTAAIALWTILEATVDELAMSLLREPDGWTDRELILSLQGPLVVFAQASEVERSEYLCGELKHAVKASLRKGVGRFQAVLKPLGLAGPIDENSRWMLLELSHVRNVLVHRGGRADQRFLDACPWLDHEVGTEIKPLDVDFRIYWTAAWLYALQINEQLYRLNGEEPTEALVAHIEQDAAELAAFVGEHRKKKTKAPR